ncbi:MAG: twin-arginine translocation signal domain-containing protein [Burkholderiales bacterium]
MTQQRQRLSRRKFLAGAAAGTCVIALGAGAQDKPQPGLRKRSREHVRYQNEPYLGRTCSRCVLYQGDGACVILDGAVSPN